MTEITYTLTLRSDAEPGTGLGTELLDDLVPLDSRGRPFIPASHLRGLAREELRTISSQLGWGVDLEQLVFGDEGRDGNDGIEGCARFSHARLGSNANAAALLQVSRTAVNEHGGAADGSLRTVQAIPTGTVFTGTVHVAPNTDPRAIDAVQLALTCVAAIGGNRTRGAGRCVVAIKGSESTAPSALLRKLHQAREQAVAARSQRTTSRSAPAATGKAVLIELTFDAHDPVCCPTVPLTATNVVQGGFSIPASAVQGALLTALDQHNHEQASALFASDKFRAWPLLPCAMSVKETEGVLPVWTSLTHRMSKLAAGMADASPVFKDKLIKPYPWQEVKDCAPLKAADGVLLDDSRSDRVTLWRAADMPRQHSAHVNLQGKEPGLFSVEAMAPLVYRGLIAVPESLVQPLLDAIRAQGTFSFGRARAVRGSGLLSAKTADVQRSFGQSAARSPVFVVQSPIAIPTDLLSRGESALSGAEILKQLVERAGFGPCVQAEAVIEFRFGWNRHGEGARVGGTNRLSAVPVIASGSVFRLNALPSDLESLLVRGIGAGRERGFGAVLQHPGLATSLYSGGTEIPKLKSRDNAGEIADRLIALSPQSGLSTSAVAQLVRIARAGTNPLEDFVARQKQRPTASWKRWERVAEDILSVMKDESVSNETRSRAFKAWTDSMTVKGDRE